MNDGKISVRYSRALFESALEKKILDRVYRDMILISEISAIDEVKELLGSPVIPASKKRSVLAGLFEKSIDKTTLSLIYLLIKNGRESYLPSVARVFISETHRYQGITETILVTAVKTDDETRKQVVDFVGKAFKTKVELKESVNRDLIGGFILKINDNYLDASLRTRLRAVRKGLAAGTSGKE